MQWLTVGRDGDAFRTRLEDAPGWYWTYRPLNIGPRRYDAERGVVIPVLGTADGGVSSPLTDLQSTSVDDLVPLHAATRQRYLTYFAGPISPGASSTTIDKRPGQPLKGKAPVEGGWYWCRTEAALAHVDADGIGPVYMVHREGQGMWVYPAAFGDGSPCDVFELGFAEPLVSDGGLIDATGTVGRVRAELFGRITAHPPLPARFPVVGA